MLLELDQKVRDSLHKLIDENCIFRANPKIQYFPYLKPGYILPQGPYGMPYTWCFYLRRLAHHPRGIWEVSCMIAYDLCKKMQKGEEYSKVQLCGIETSSIPLLTGIQMAFMQVKIDINVFTVRKDRKAYGLCQYVDGIPNTDPVVFIDDVINSGSSFARTMEVCKYELDLEPAKNIYSIISDVDVLKYNDKDIQVNSFFRKNDFDKTYDPAKYWLPKDCDKLFIKRPSNA